MDKATFKQVLLRLGFVDSKFLEDIENEEKSENLTSDNMVSKMWKTLAGEAKGHVTLNNVRIFLLAMMGTYTDPGLPRADQNLQKIENNEYGYFNDFGDLFLDQDDVPKVQKSYH